MSFLSFFPVSFCSLILLSYLSSPLLPSSSPSIFPCWLLNPFSYSFFLLIENFSSPDPFELQVAGGCEMHIRDASVGFVRVGYQGSDFLSFQKNLWVPSPEGGNRAKLVCALFNLYQGTQEIIHKLLSDTCPRFLLSLLDAGKAYLQRQGQSCTLPPQIFCYKNHTFSSC